LSTKKRHNEVLSSTDNFDDAAISRRAAIAGGAGSVAILAVPDIFSPTQATPSLKSASAAESHFYIFGTQVASESSQAVQAVAMQRSRTNGTAPHLLATQLAALPVKSKDGKRLLLVSKNQTADSVSVKIEVIDANSARLIAEKILMLHDIAPETQVLVKPLMADDSATVALVLFDYNRNR
jgi:hypothetical protein